MTVTATTAAPRPVGEALLEVRGVDVTYERVVLALRGVDAVVRSGQITVALGANGAGKTSLLRAICGFLPGDRAAVSAGEIVFQGERIQGWRPHRTARRGVVMVPEREKIFATLSVEENLRLSAVTNKPKRLKELEALVYDTFPVLQTRAKQLAGLMSGGERQMLAISSALLCDPQLLLLDELSLGLAPNLVDELFALVRDVAMKQGLTILMVEQNAVSSLRVADYAYVLEGGQVVLEGPPDVVGGHENIRDFYMGLGGSGDSVRSFAKVKQYSQRRWLQ